MLDNQSVVRVLSVEQIIGEAGREGMSVPSNGNTA
jgi:hypothetical protein